MKLNSYREMMVERQLESRGIIDERLLDAFRKVPRHRFVPPEIQHLAYQDSPLSIGEGQTISQPYMVALMLETLNLKKSDTVLEIGTGSGYQTALLAELASEVYTVERIGTLMANAKAILTELGYDNIYYKTGDGSKGWEGGNPPCDSFDKIIVAAAAPKIPSSLMKQLKLGGVLSIPLGSRFMQDLVVIHKDEDGITHTSRGGCAFVPLIGDEGWE